MTILCEEHFLFRNLKEKFLQILYLRNYYFPPIKKTRNLYMGKWLRRLSSPTSRSHRPYAAGLALYSATSPYYYPQPVGSIGNPPFPSQRGLPPDIFGGARWEVYCRSIHPSMGRTNTSVLMRQKRRQRERTMLKEHDLDKN